MRLLAILCLLPFAACDSPTSMGGEIVPWLQGSWDYAASQTSPTLRMNGTLSITRQIGDSLSGSIEYVEVDAQGHGRTRLQLFTGHIRDSRNVVIYAYDGNRTRAHAGVLAGDSIGGSYQQPINDQQTWLGTFIARRR